MKPVGSGLKGKSELAANIVIILSGLLLGIKLIKPELLSFSEKEPPLITAGTKLALPAVDWSMHDKTLVLALKQGCPFCSESAPFYQRLAHEAEQLKSIHLMALLPQEVSAGKKYLEELRVPISDVRQAQLASLKISYTPTLLLLDRNGVVNDVWVGKLSSRRDAEVLSKTGLAQTH